MKRRRLPCTARIAWRPSSWMIGALAMLGVLAALGLLASDLPRAWASPCAALACAAGCLQARHEARRAHRMLVIDSAGATLDGESLAQLVLRWRGPCAFLAARGKAGRIHRLAWWPDTLDAAARRALRLALANHSPSAPA